MVDSAQLPWMAWLTCFVVRVDHECELLLILKKGELVLMGGDTKEQGWPCETSAPW